ncbi:MAG: S41 family peptidase, partial [Phycisphaerae bacterium]|nr:S41 family peptidase [Phycisphaerae bacterium]
PPADRPGAPVRRIPDTPEGNLLDGRVAYLLIPGCPNGDADQLRRWARALNDRVHTLGRQNPVGWIIDLRLNGGGNVWPMLLGLRGILLDGVCMTSLESASVTSRFGVSATHGAWIDWGSGPQTQLDWAADPPAESTVPGRGTVAVLLGPWTMSSGEALAIALRSAGARTFGEPTAGLTTVTNMFPLSDGSTLILPVSRMGDAGGRPVHGRLTPDQLERFGDWPTPDDEAARAAAAWVTSRAGRPVVAD